MASSHTYLTFPRFHALHLQTALSRNTTCRCLRACVSSLSRAGCTDGVQKRVLVDAGRGWYPGVSSAWARRLLEGTSKQLLSRKPGAGAAALHPRQKLSKVAFKGTGSLKRRGSGHSGTERHALSKMTPSYPFHLIDLGT